MQALVSKRSHKPSAFAPAVGVKNSSSSPGSPAPSHQRRPLPSSASSSSKTFAKKAPTALRSALVHLLSGGLSAGLVRASLQPLDTAKTRLQFSRQATRSLSSLRALLLEHGGLRGLYRGMVPGVTGIVPAAAVYMLTFQTVRAQLAARFPRRARDVCVAMAAAVGDVAASVVRVPCEVLKQRLQVGVYADMRAAIAAVGGVSVGASATAPALLRGVRSLYAGLGAQLVRDVPYVMAEFVVYEQLKLAAGGRGASHATEEDGDVGKGRPKRGEGLWMGAVAGVVAAIVSNPADVVKTRLMTQVRGAATVGVRSTAYRGVADAFVRVVREEGPAAFAKGIAPRMAAKALQSGLFFAVYERMRIALALALQVNGDGGAAEPAS